MTALPLRAGGLGCDFLVVLVIEFGFFLGSDCSVISVHGFRSSFASFPRHPKSSY